MFECLVAQLAIAYNLHTTEAHVLYRCEGIKKFQYLDRDKKFEGVYDIENNIFIITNERKGI